MTVQEQAEQEKTVPAATTAPAKGVVVRTNRGTFAPGSTGNPSGRKRGVEKRIRELIEPDFDSMIKIMVDMVMGRPVKQTVGVEIVEMPVKHRDRIEALKLIMDRGFGKAKQTIDMTTDIERGGLNLMDVDALELAALQALDESISKQLDPRARRVIDVTKQSAAVASAARAMKAEAAVAEPVVEPVKVDEPTVEPAVVPMVIEPVKNIVKHVFQGSANVAFATLDLDSGDVDVVFSSGMRYRFGNFTQALLDEWKLALSPGKWFNAELKDKPKEHPVRKIR